MGRPRSPQPWLLALLLSAAAGCGSQDRPPPPAPEAPPGEGQGGASSVDGSGAAGGTGGGAGAGAQPGGAGNSGSGGGGGSAGSGPPPAACIPLDSCQRYCAAFGNAAPSCGLGNAAQCGCVCEQRFNGPCPEELGALVQCIGDTPSVDCATRGRIISGCEQESVALELCDFRAREQLCAQSTPRCLPFCTALQLSFCPQGPESVTSCLCGCEASAAARCQAQLDAFMDCSADAPTFTCDSGGRNVPSSCLDQWQALNACLRPDAG